MDSGAIIAAHKTMTNKQLRRLLLVEYRCAKGCLLLHVWNTPGGAAYYRPGINISENMHRRTGASEVGRIPEMGGLVACFDDSDWVWVTDEQERTGIGSNYLTIGCKHCLGLRFPAKTIKADVAAATPGDPVRVRDFWARPKPPKQE
ncbi:hypothetical protein [Mycobacterium attenuatum]|uniref:hypothetical protein n=1 Tax=Mycobacterium attenuatum TaxID=2341086 RepID=UPI000F02064A|nr:hypothetical protein [Mycobacterium attenuatum]VBA60524.1 hypothetical protein LAUMK41_04039 [Mycobacterium attenuatum]